MGNRRNQRIYCTNIYHIRFFHCMVYTYRFCTGHCRYSDSRIYNYMVSDYQIERLSMDCCGNGCCVGN